jgi:cytochrome bd-type quinol oxidase subunit 2
MLVRHQRNEDHPSMNWLAVLCAGVAYWLVAFVWYSLLFGGIWGNEQTKHRRDICESAKGEFAGMLFATFLGNLVAAAGIAFLMRRMVIGDLPTAIKLGAGVAVAFDITTLTIVHVWERKSTKVWMIDASYHLVGCIVVATILVLWP